jgi:tetratricopeptide (TPR) repeat protein
MLVAPGTDLKALIIGGQVALDARDFQTAEKLLFSNIREDPALNLYRAQLRYRTGRIDESQKILRDLIQQQQGNSAAYNLLGWCYHQQGKTKEAVQSFERAIELAPDQESNYLDLGTVLIRNGRPLVARVLAENAIRRFPNSARIHEMKGLVEMSLSHYSDAVALYARSVQLDPTSPEAHLGLAVAQSEAGMIAEATTTYEQGLKRFPSHAGHYAEYGQMLMKRVEGGEAALEPVAVRLLEKAIELDPALPEPHYQLGNLAMNAKQYEKALQHLMLAGKLSPESSKIHFVLGRVYTRLGRTQEAADEQRKFAKLKAVEDKGKSHAPLTDSRVIADPEDKK